jgi:hypothetical protein
MRQSGILNIVSLFMVMLQLQSCSSSDTNTGNKLSFNLEKGKTYVYEMQMNIEQGMGQQRSSDITNTYLMEVTDNKDDVKTIRTTYKRFGMKMHMGNMNIDVDSDHPAPDTSKGYNPMKMLDVMFAALKNKSFIMKVDPEGNVTEIIGFGELMQSTMEAMAIPEQSKAQIRTLFMRQFNEETLKRTFTQWFNIYPNKAVKVGDNWTRELQVNPQMPISSTVTYTVKKIEGNTITINGDSKTKSDSSQGTFDAVYHINAKTGLILDGNLNSTFGSPAAVTSKGIIKGKEQ